MRPAYILPINRPSGRYVTPPSYGRAMGGGHLGEISGLQGAQGDHWPEIRGLEGGVPPGGDQ